MHPCLTLSIIRYGLRVSGAIQGKELHPPQHLVVVAIEKGAFRLFLNVVGQLAYIFIYIHIYIYIYI